MGKKKQVQQSGVFIKESPRFSLKQKRMTKSVLLVVIILLAVFIFLASSGKENKTDTSTSQTAPVSLGDRTNYIRDAGNSDADLSKVVASQSQRYDELAPELRDSLPDKWDSEMVDKAIFSLIYADKIGAYSQAQGLYYAIQAAKDNGVDVESNSANISQAELDAVKARIDEAEAKGISE